MWSASSVRRWYVVAGLAGAGVIAACANGGAGGSPLRGGSDGGADAEQGADADDNSDAEAGASSSSGSTSSGTSGTSSGTTTSSSGGSADWVDMTNNATGCDNKAGTPCGYSATNNGDGWTCLCYDGTALDPWNCEAPNSCVIPGSACPTSSAATCSTDGGSSSGDDGGTTTLGDGGGWVNMNNGATACDNKPGTPCGWATTNNGKGYTCTCYIANAMDGWGCEPAGTPTLCQ